MVGLNISLRSIFKPSYSRNYLNTNDINWVFLVDSDDQPDKNSVDRKNKYKLTSSLTVYKTRTVYITTDSSKHEDMSSVRSTRSKLF